MHVRKKKIQVALNKLDGSENTNDFLVVVAVVEVCAHFGKCLY